MSTTVLRGFTRYTSGGSINLNAAPGRPTFTLGASADPASTAPLLVATPRAAKPMLPTSMDASIFAVTNFPPANLRA